MNLKSSRLTSLAAPLLASALLALSWHNAEAQSGTIRFTSASLTVSEGAGVLLVGIERTSSNAGARIRFATAGVTAVGGTDFHPINETHTFQAGQVSLSLALQVFDNPTFQNDRTLKLQLSDPLDLTIGSPGEVTIMIADNDEPGSPGRGAAGTNLLAGAFAVATNSAGAITLGGNFRTFNGTPRNHLARVLPNGELDPSFAMGAGPNDRVWALAVEPDDDLLIAGDFSTVNGESRNRIARLKNNGDLDLTFNPGTGADRLIESIEVLPDDRILIGGFFTSYNGTPRSDVAILNANGTLDTAFNAVTPPSFVGHVARRHGDGFLVGGEVGFGPDANVTNALMRFTATGARDTSFEVSIGDLFLNKVTGIIVQPDLSVVICGDFLGVNGQPSSSVAKLTPTGGLAPGFNVGAGADNWVFRITQQPDDRLLIAGFFLSVNGQSRAGIARLNANGSLDSTFNPGAAADDVVYHALHVGDRILAAGGFGRFDGYDRFGFATLSLDGSLRTEPLRFDHVSAVAGPALSLGLAVDAGRSFRVLTSPTVTGGWTAISTNSTARRSFQLTEPVAGSGTFFRVEQGFPEP